MMRSPSAVFVFEIAIRPRIRHIADRFQHCPVREPREDDLVRELAHSQLTDAQITGFAFVVGGLVHAGYLVK